MKTIHHRAVLLSAMLALAVAHTGHATEQMPYTFIVNTNGTWILHSDYLDGDCIVIDNEVANKKTILSVRDLLPEKDIAMTTAGDQWGDRLLWHLFSIGSTNLFSARSASGARFVINLDAAKELDPQPFAEVLEERDREALLAVLKTAKADLLQETLYMNVSDRIIAAVYHSGMLLERRAKPFLEELASITDGKYVVIGRVRALAKEALGKLEAVIETEGSNKMPGHIP